MARIREPYADRIARLEAQGYSRSQARGHPVKAEPPIEVVRAVGTGTTAAMTDRAIGTKGGRWTDKTRIAVRDAKGRVRVFEVDAVARDKLKRQVHEIFPDAPEPEDSPT